MEHFRQSKIYVGLALLMSFSFSLLFSIGIMGRIDDQELTIFQFLSVIDNFLFCSLMFFLVLATWLMRGSNNRAVIFCWCVGLVCNFGIFWLTEDYFLNENRNVYALSFINTVSVLPLVIICQYRLTLSVFVLKRLALKLFEGRPFNNYLRNLKPTNFEINMIRALTIGLLLEFLYSFYLVSFAMFNRIPHDGSIYETIVANDAWDPFVLYSNLQHVVTISIITVLIYHMIKESKQPDEFMKNVSMIKKKQIISQMLEERRERGKK